MCHGAVPAEAGNAAVPALEGAAAPVTAALPGTAPFGRVLPSKEDEQMEIIQIVSLAVTSVLECSLFKEIRLVC